MTENLKKTVLHANHVQAKARMVPFGGWDMPVQYKGLMQEHEAVRSAAGLFDVSHMGEFLITGAGAKEFLNGVLTNDVSKLADGKCQYTLMCYENGTVVDDLIVSQVSEDCYFMVVNASNIEKDWQWLVSHKTNDVTLTNLSADYALLALQGPQSQKILNEFYNQDFANLKYYHFQSLEGATPFQNQNLKTSTVIFRTGYTGEDGFEILVPNAQASATWDRLLQVGHAYGLEPAGLGARDTLRLEVAFSLYGHEISDAITGLEANLGWVIKFDKDDFIGKAALQKEKETGSKRKVRGFEMLDAGVPREGYKIFSGETEVGFVTSGTHSPSLKKSIGLALVNKEVAEFGQELSIDIRGKKKKIQIVKPPFYKKS